MANIENGLFSGQGASSNAGDPSIAFRFVNAVVKGGPGK